MVLLTLSLFLAPYSFAFNFPSSQLPPFPPSTSLSLSSASSLYRGIKLLAIPVTDSALIRYSSALSPPSLISHSHSAFSFFPNVLTQASFFLAGNQAQFAQDFSDCCCTLLEKKKKKKDA